VTWRSTAEPADESPPAGQPWASEPTWSPSMTRRSKGRQRARLLACAPQASHVLGRGCYALPHFLEQPAEQSKHIAAPSLNGANHCATRGASSGFHRARIFLDRALGSALQSRLPAGIGHHTFPEQRAPDEHPQPRIAPRAPAGVKAEAVALMGYGRRGGTGREEVVMRGVPDEAVSQLEPAADRCRRPVRRGAPR